MTAISRMWLILTTPMANNTWDPPIEVSKIAAAWKSWPFRPCTLATCLQLRTGVFGIVEPDLDVLFVCLFVCLFTEAREPIVAPLLTPLFCSVIKQMHPQLFPPAVAVHSWVTDD